MDNTNIFFHAPKELTTDAFWVWLLYFIDSDDKYEYAKQQIFNSLILKDCDQERRVTNISVDRQQKCSHGRIDFIFNFTFIDDNSTHSVLFEDKTWSNTTTEQLTGYKDDYPCLYRYCYYKLGYINVQELKTVRDCGYDIITAKMMADCLKQFKDLHILIKYYYDYIKETFVDYIDSFENELFSNNNFDLLWEAQAQLFLADKLWYALPETIKNNCYIQNGTSSGRPWTEIVLIDNEPITSDYQESIFWRIDIRSEKFYIRLNQYSWYEDDENNTIWKKKQERLSSLREASDYILSTYPINLKKGKPTDRGSFEQEIVIFFLEENNWDCIFKDIPLFSQLFIDMYKYEVR